MHNAAWFTSAPPCSTRVPCGNGMHTVRWNAGSFEVPSHPDGEAELVLAALGGGRAACIDLAETWRRHAEDLHLLAIGPRSPADTITVTWDSVAEVESPAQLAAAQQHLPFRPPLMRQEIERERHRTADVLALLALGPEFGYRLAGHVVAAHAARAEPQHRPALTAALEGRLAPAAEAWLGVDPDQVQVTPHDGDGWGSVELAGQKLWVMLPVTWLASVWACGLALAGGQLVVAVTAPGWPDAQVLALPGPGQEPVELAAHGSAGADRTAHWEV